MYHTPKTKVTGGASQKYEDVEHTPESSRRIKWWDGKSKDVGPLSVFTVDKWTKFVEKGSAANQKDRRQMYEKAKEAFHHYLRDEVDPALKDKSPLADICKNLRGLEYRVRYIYDIMQEGKQATDTAQTQSV